MKDIEGQLGLFGNTVDTIHLGVIKGGKEIVKPDFTFGADRMEYIETSQMSVPEIFGFGKYTELRIITFSSDIKFLSELAQNYQKVELIIGLSNTINKGTNEIFAVQMSEQRMVSNLLKNNARIMNMVCTGAFHAWVAREIWSHQKLYILRDDNGNTRVITGSANASTGAWHGDHIEDIQYCDSPAFYEKSLNDFETLRSLSADNIALQADTDPSGNIIDEIPTLKEIIKTKQAVVIESAKAAETVYEMAPAKDAKIIEAAIKQAKMKIIPNKEGKIAIAPEEVLRLRKAVSSLEIADGCRIKNPALTVDIGSKKLYYGGVEFTTGTQSDKLQTACEAFIAYMKGFDNLEGDSTWQKKQYFKLMSYMFISPFIPAIRHVANENRITSPRFFPMYCYIYGPRDAGKSAFAECCRNMMTGIRIELLKCSKMPAGFTFKDWVAGFQFDPDATPVIIDELPAGTITRIGSYIKQDTDPYLINENTCTTFFLSNGSPTLSQDLTKRILFLPVDGKFDQDKTLEDAQAVNIAKDNIGTELYREFLRRLYIKIDGFIEHINNGSDPAPDVFELSSGILHDILSDIIPEEEWFSPFDIKEVMGTNSMDRRPREIILDKWKFEKGSFRIDRKRDTLEITFSDGSGHADSRAVTIMKNEAPTPANCKVFGDKIVLNLAYTEKWLRIKFRRAGFPFIGG
jgi:hypothetical protein